MRRRKAKRSLPKEVVLKIDKDFHVDHQLEREYVRNTIATLSQYHIDVRWIRVTRTQHGRHYYINIDPPVDAPTANRLQYLLGDDPRRFDYNRARINSGLVEWNKLFESIGRKMVFAYGCSAEINR
jgi:hypothetical protein